MMWGEPTGYTYEADQHCVEHATERFGMDDHGYVPEDAEDSYGNPVGAIFSLTDGEAIAFCSEGDHLFCTRCGHTSEAFNGKDFGWGETLAETGRIENVCPNCGSFNNRED